MKRTLPLSLFAAAAALSLAACSSSPVASTSDGGDAKPVSGAEAAVQTAQDEIDKFSAVPEFTAPNDAFDVSELAGKRIAIVALDQQTPSLVSTTEGIKAAAEAAGLKTSLFDAKQTPSEMTAGIAQAVATNADGIVLVGISVGLVAKQLGDAAAAGIPVVAANNNQPDATAPGQGAGDGIFATAAPDFHQAGVLAASGAIVKTGGAAKALLISTEQIDPAPAVLSGMEDGLKACTTCAVLDTKTVQIQDWFNGNLASVTASLVTTHKDANVALPVFSAMAQTMIPAAQQAGSAGNITFYTTSAPPDAAKLLETNAALGGLVGQSDENVGWLSVNQVMRGMLGLEPGDPVVPTRYLTADVVKESGTDQTELFGDAYVDGFKTLWGLA